MGVAEGNALAYQIIGQVGGGGETATGRFAHHFAVGLQGRDHVAEGAQAAFDGVHGVVERLFVFLVVLVVGQRLALHQGQQADQVAVDAAGLAAHQLRHVRVFLLRHDGAAGAETVGQVDKVELGAGPQHQLFADP